MQARRRGRLILLACILLWLFVCARFLFLVSSLARFDNEKLVFLFFRSLNKNDEFNQNGIDEGFRIHSLHFRVVVMWFLYLMYKIYLSVCKNTDLCIALISNAEVFHLFYLYTNTFVMTPFRPSAMLKKPPFNTRVYYVNVKGSYLVLE